MLGPVGQQEGLVLEVHKVVRLVGEDQIQIVVRVDIPPDR